VTSDPPTLGQYGDFEIYPMPMFATLAVADVAAVARWYSDALGFRTMFAGPPIGGQPSIVHVRRHKYQDLLLVPRPAGTPAAAPLTLTLSFSSDEVDELANRARSVPAVGVSAIAGPVDTPWNSRDLSVTDPAGHQLVFTCRQANPDPEQVKRLQAMFAKYQERGSSVDSGQAGST
jgi:uncharacterized glyoxalase superfamily protein PhnB